MSALARMGVDEQTCQVVGRWHSNSWLAYCKKGRYIRYEDMRRISQAVLGAVSLREQSTVLVHEGDCQVRW